MKNSISWTYFYLTGDWQGTFWEVPHSFFISNCQVVILLAFSDLYRDDLFLIELNYKIGWTQLFFFFLRFKCTFSVSFRVSFLNLFSYEFVLNVFKIFQHKSSLFWTCIFPYFHFLFAGYRNLYIQIYHCQRFVYFIFHRNQLVGLFSQFFSLSDYPFFFCFDLFVFLRLFYFKLYAQVIYLFFCTNESVQF